MSKTDSPPPLYGLVLAGGRSSRMHQDKSLLHYHGMSQVEHCFTLLSALCPKAFISNREEQSSLKEHRRFPQIHDQFIDIGPLGGILSAMIYKPDTAWLVLACDLPFIDRALLNRLVENRNTGKYATAYESAHDAGMPEPLCAIYEPTLMAVLRDHMNRGIYCPRKILANSDIEMLKQPGTNSLNNINSESEFQKAIRMLGST